MGRALRRWLRENAANGGPTPGDPNQSLQNYLEGLDPRGELPDLPTDFGDPTPDRDQEPIDSGDAGRPPSEVVGELREDLKQTDRAKEFDRQAREDGFRSIDDL